MSKLPDSTDVQTKYADIDNDQLWIGRFGDGATVTMPYGNTRTDEGDRVVQLSPYDASRVAQDLIVAQIPADSFPENVRVFNALGVIHVELEPELNRFDGDGARALAVALLRAADAFDGVWDGDVEAEPVDTSAEAREAADAAYLAGRNG